MKQACRVLGMTQAVFIRRAIEEALERVEADGLPPVPKLDQADLGSHYAAVLTRLC